MILINTSFEIIHQESNLYGIFKQIELAGRTCYKSEYKITSDSAKEFVDRMIKSGHGAILEHGTVYLAIEESQIHKYSKYYTNKYSVIKEYDPNTQYEMGGQMVMPRYYCITTNYRVIVENGWLDDLKCICEPTEYHERRVSVRFVCDRGISHEFVRHRVDSFAQESTRFCDYIKDKFNGSVSFILPSYIKEEDRQEAEQDLLMIESLYFKWRKKGYKAEESRFVLPMALKTELVMTGFVSDWKHFFKLRCDKAAHQQARELANPLCNEFKKLNYI